jgi:hypothetical protein
VTGVTGEGCFFCLHPYQVGEVCPSFNLRFGMARCRAAVTMAPMVGRSTSNERSYARTTVVVWILHFLQQSVLRSISEADPIPKYHSPRHICAVFDEPHASPACGNHHLPVYKTETRANGISQAAQCASIWHGSTDHRCCMKLPNCC